MLYINKFSQFIYKNLLIGLVGCSTDYKVSSIEDTATPPSWPGTDGPEGEESCVRLTLESTRSIPEPDTGTVGNGGSQFGDFCMLYTNFDDPISLGEINIDGFRVYGMENSEFPDGYDIFVAGLHSTSAADYDINEHLYPYYGNYYSDSVGATEGSVSDDYEWIAEGDETEVGTLNACSPNCIWESVVAEIYDETKATEEDCSDYLSDLYVCFSFSAYDSGEASSDSSCTSGYGQFLLMPTHYRDLNQDNISAYILRPIQTSGTGRLTGAARISSITITQQPQPAPTLNVVYSRQRNLNFNTDDTLDEMPVAVTVLSTTPTPFNGSLSGAAPFFIQGISPGISGLFKVNMSWTCDTLPTENVLQRPVGYQMTPQQIGCGALTQPFILRHTEERGTPELSIEVYGIPGSALTVPLVPLPSGGETFQYDQSGTYIDGDLLSYNGDEAVVRINSAIHNLLPICSSGVYTLSKAQ